MERRTQISGHGLTGLLSAALIALACGGAVLAFAATPMPRDIDPLVQDMDTSVSPGADFAAYSCGKWIKEHPIPASERGWGIANLVQEDIYRQCVEICQAAAAANAAPGTSAQKVGDFWATGMDTVAIEKAGTAPMKPLLDQVAAIQDRAGLLALAAEFHVKGIGTLYGMYVGQDERNSDKYAVHVYQGGISMPNRDYYLKDDSSTAHVRGEYVKHVTAMFQLLGDSPETAARESQTVLAIETALARRSRTLEELRDPWANYNKMGLAGLGRMTPNVDWTAQFSRMGLAAVDTVIVGQPDFFAAVDSCLGAVPLADWRTYMRWNVVHSLAGRLDKPFETESFRFYGTVLNGATQMRPRWKRVLDAEERSIGELLGQEWVKKYCPPSTKQRYEKLTTDILSAFRERIQGLPWMSAATKTRALSKLDHVSRKVAYPDHWRDYTTLQLDRSSYAANQMRVNEWWFRHEADKLGKPIDRTEWGMTPQTYNAYYDGSMVEIVLPAAAFALPGLPDSVVDDAVLYGYAGGSTIGHEITHGFDDEGRQFDDRGNMNPWWGDQDSVQFMQRAQKLVDQFDQYKVGERHVRGRATLGENIADLGGVRLGYEAFKKTDQWKTHQVINGLTADQRYFLGYALSWLGHRRPQSLDQQIMVDVHAPEFLRINGPLANTPEFYDAFGIKPGDAMYRADSVRVVIW